MAVESPETEQGQSRAPSGRGSLSEALNTHAYPRLLHTSRLLFRAFHAAIHATTLRNWYVRRALRRLLIRTDSTDNLQSRGDAADDGAIQNRPKDNRTILDVGCGAGDHLFYAARMDSPCKCVGYDRSPNAVALCRRHSPPNGRMQFACEDLESVEEFPPADLVLCITVLQYIRRDVALLAAIRRAIRPSGALLLYVPVRNERLLPFHARIVEGGPSDYDAAQGRRHLYSSKDIFTLLSETDFEINSVEQAYGTLGKLAYEMHALALHGISHPKAIIKLFAAAAGLIYLPLIFVLMALDYVLPITRGNGLLVVARPAPRRSGIPGNISVRPA